MAHHMILPATLDYLKRISGLLPVLSELRLETGWILGELAAVSFMWKRAGSSGCATTADVKRSEHASMNQW
jgi:hypothetical protein